MINIAYERATDAADAVRRAAASPRTVFIGGGTNLLDLMKAGVATPQKLVDVSRLPLNGVMDLPNGGLRIGAMTRNSDAANHPLVRGRYPLLSQAFLAGASGQLRNMATVGGNLMQRTRCYYFYDTAFQACNKRVPGSGCAAKDGMNRIHAILGASDQCVATNPSDMNVALAALGATIGVLGPQGERRIAMADFHRLPGATPEIDTTLMPGELVLGVDLPPSPFAAHSSYLKVRDRASYAFALVSVAAALDLQNGTVADAAIALGGVAHKPWRLRAAEQALIGKPLTDDSIQLAAAALLQGAVPLKHNAFKLQLAQRSIRRALQTAGATA